LISCAKLARLPRSQRYRKIAKTAAEAETRLRGTDRATCADTICADAALLADLAFLRDAALLVAREDTSDDASAGKALSPAVREKLAQAAGLLSSLLVSPCPSGGEIARALNDIHRLLMAQVGDYPADWDFDRYAALNAPQGGAPQNTVSGRRVFPGMRIYLEDLRSPFNIGSIFRAAESFGVERILLSPLCASPEHPRAQRTAMGTTGMVPWDTGVPLSSADLTTGGPFFALETGGTPLNNFTFPRQGTMLTGSEELGLSPDALALADTSLGRVSIPTWGAKGSLNVSVAFGIVCQAWAEALAATSPID
jgi:TrmH family RNA methyltransferase